MATPVVTVASRGLPVVDVTATKPLLGMPVTEALNGRGIAVTKVASGGLPVTFSTVADWPPSGGGGGSTFTSRSAMGGGVFVNATKSLQSITCDGTMFNL